MRFPACDKSTLCSKIRKVTTSSPGFQLAMASSFATNSCLSCLTTSSNVLVLRAECRCRDLSTGVTDGRPSQQSCQVAADILSGNKGVEKKFLASVKEISEGYYRLLYSAPEAILGSEQWKELLLQPPLSRCVVAVAVEL